MTDVGYLGSLSNWLRSVAGRLGVYFSRTGPVGPLRRIQALSISADTFITVGLAGSLFFSISPGEAKSKIALYLVLTVAPFAIVGPLLAPALDRGPTFRRIALVVSAAARIVCAVLMSFDLNSLLLFPEALGSLAASKLYMITKAALVPDLLGERVRTTGESENLEGVDESIGASVDTEATPKAPGAKEPSHSSRRSRRRRMHQSSQLEFLLVKTNANLAFLAAVVGLIGGSIAGGILKTPFLGSPWVFRISVLPLLLIFPEIRTLNRKHSRTKGAGTPLDEPELSDAPISTGVKGGYSLTLLASSAMAVLRAGVGFFTFLLAFELKRLNSPAYLYGLALIASAAGAAVATLVVPGLRKLLAEQQLLVLALVVEATSAVVVAIRGGVYPQMALAFMIGMVASAGKLAFDAIVQRQLHSFRQGRAFSRYEMRFQLAWVLGAIVPTVVALPLVTGDIVVAASAMIAAFSYAAGRAALRSREEDEAEFESPE